MKVHHMRAEQARPTALFLEDMVEKAAVAAAGETVESLVGMVESGRGEFWVVTDEAEPVGVAFTQLVDRPKDRVLAVLALGGYGTGWAHNIRETLKQYARENGASKLATIGRPGWGRLYGLKPAGFYYEDTV